MGVEFNLCGVAVKVPCSLLPLWGFSYGPTTALATRPASVGQRARVQATDQPPWMWHPGEPQLVVSNV